MMRFQIFRRLTLRGFQWFWRLRSVQNGKIVATGGEGYYNRGDVEEIVGKIRTFAPLAEVEVE